MAVVIICVSDLNLTIIDKNSFCEYKTTYSSLTKTTPLQHGL